MTAPITMMPVNVAILTISDKRTAQDDSSGTLLSELVKDAGHAVVHRAIVPENIYEIRRVVSDWIADANVGVIITSGGTGFAEKNQTPEAIDVLLDKQVEGFGELFRQLSYADIGGAAIQSRAISGYANRTWICCLPGSNHACRLAWEHLIRDQLDSEQKPCNFASKVGPRAPLK